MHLELDEVRRLTGPNLLWDEPGAIIDVFIRGGDKLAVINTWQQWMDKILLRVGWQQTHTYRLYAGGASMALSAPMDSLYTACDFAELAWDCTVAELNKLEPVDVSTRLNTLLAALAEEQNPKLLAIMRAAKQQAVTAISDDDEFSLGMGSSVQTWPINGLPDPDQLNWTTFRDIPRAFITGTNGKSTSVRLASEIAKAAGYCAGVTSTDFIKVGDDIIDTGDYSGPGGARMLLRDRRTEMAFLEVARGGILRRGIPVEQVDAALVTNVASDHLGQYGINTVEELAQVKFVVAKGLGPDSVLVTNADNQYAIAQAKNLNCQICWFSESADNPLVLENLRHQLPVVYVQDNILTFVDKQGEVIPILPVAEIPMTMNGAARHNVQNAMGVIGLCMALTLPLEAIKAGLRQFGSNAIDNPGRGNIYQHNGATFMVDFAHNAHSVEAMIDTAKHLNANRYIVMFSNAGDRSNEEIRQLSQGVAKLNADVYIIAELEKYLRGRESRELIELSQDALLDCNVLAKQIQTVSSPFAGAELAKKLAQDGDVIVLFTLDEREKVHALFD